MPCNAASRPAHPGHQIGDPVNRGEEADLVRAFGLAAPLAPMPRPAAIRLALVGDLALRYTEILD